MRIQVKARNGDYEFDAGDGERILFAGLRHGIPLPYECATGTCGKCRARLTGGCVDDLWATAPGKKLLKAEQGDLLMCQSIARGDVAIEISKSINASEACAYGAKAMAGTVGSLRYLTHDVATLDILLDGSCDFDAGQFMAVSAPGVHGMRGYSMVNFARDTNHLELLIKKKPGGGFSEWLFGGKAIGASLEMFGPLGKATFCPDVEKNILCIAGGSGIAGMMSILSRACQERYFDQHVGHVFFGVRTAKDAFYLSELSEFCANFPQSLSIAVALSDEEVPAAAAMQYPHLRFERGLVHEVAKRNMAGRYENVRAYVAGPPPAVDATIRVLLQEAKLSADNIRYDKFS
jgi:toluene monooxygenase electron transfer component